MTPKYAYADPNQKSAVSRAREVLSRAREIISNGWIKGYEAVNLQGEAIQTDDDKAVRFCSTGAIRRAICEAGAGSQLGGSVEQAAHEFLHNAIGSCDIPYWNDQPQRTFDEVIEAFETAEKLAAASLAEIEAPEAAALIETLEETAPKLLEA